MSVPATGAEPNGRNGFAPSPCSRRSTAVAPSGIAAPVAIPTASPGDSTTDAPPASTSPITSHGGGPATAQPSIAEVSAAGRSLRARASAASTVPAAAASGSTTDSTGSAAPGASDLATVHGRLIDTR